MVIEVGGAENAPFLFLIVKAQITYNDSFHNNLHSHFELQLCYLRFPIHPFNSDMLSILSFYSKVDIQFLIDL